LPLQPHPTKFVFSEFSYPSPSGEEAESPRIGVMPGEVLLSNEQEDEKCDAKDDAPEIIGAGYEKLKPASI